MPRLLWTNFINYRNDLNRLILKIAIVHDWLTDLGGAEKVLQQLLALYPDAGLFCVVDFMEAEDRKFLLNKEPKVSFIQKLPFSKKKYRNYLPLMPLAVEQLDLSGYDVVISHTTSVAKGVLLGPNQLHICYCHSPMRYAWDLQNQYLEESGMLTGVKGWFVRYLLHKMRLWDSRSANGVDHFISNSDYIGRRIQKAYRRDSTTIYPNVEVEEFPLVLKKDDYYVTASRLVPYKKISLIVGAFSSMPDKKLIVIGDGPDFKKLSINVPKNVKILGRQNFSNLKKYVSEAKAFVFAAEEDFGIAPVEAQACGTPVIAFDKGGATETVLSGKTGVFFKSQAEDSIVTAVTFFEANGVEYTPEQIRAHALCFSTERFLKEFSSFVSDKWDSFNRGV